MKPQGICTQLPAFWHRCMLGSYEGSAGSLRATSCQSSPRSIEGGSWFLYDNSLNPDGVGTWNVFPRVGHASTLSHLKCSQPQWGNRKPLLAGAKALVSCPNVVTQVEVSGGDQPTILNGSIVPTYLPSTKSGRCEIGFEARLMCRLAVLSIWKAHSGYCLQTQSAFQRYLVKCRFPKDAGSELGVSLAPGQSGRKIEQQPR